MVNSMRSFKRSSHFTFRFFFVFGGIGICVVTIGIITNHWSNICSLDQYLDIWKLEIKKSSSKDMQNDLSYIIFRQWQITLLRILQSFFLFSASLDLLTDTLRVHIPRQLYDTLVRRHRRKIMTAAYTNDMCAKQTIEWRAQVHESLPLKPTFEHAIQHHLPPIDSKESFDRATDVWLLDSDVHSLRQRRIACGRNLKSIRQESVTPHQLAMSISIHRTHPDANLLTTKEKRQQKRNVTKPWTHSRRAVHGIAQIVQR